MFNPINFAVYHYAGNNPIKYLDPDGNDDVVYNSDGSFLNSISSTTSNVYVKNGNTNTLVTTQDEFNAVAATVYGESSNNGDNKEEYGIASVIVNDSDRTTGNKKLSPKQVAATIACAYGASEYKSVYGSLSNNNSKYNVSRAGTINAFLHGFDYSNGASFWDGKDIGYNSHFTSWGVHYTKKADDIYNTGDSSILQKGPRGTWDHILDSTISHGGTIFWTYSKEFMKGNQHSRLYP